MKFATVPLWRSEVNRPQATQAHVRLAITPGEPAGIGPDLVIQTCRQLPDHIEPLYFADPSLLRARAEQLGIEVLLHDYSASRVFVPGAMNIVPILLSAPCVPGVLSSSNAGYVINTLKAALTTCQEGEAGAMITGPVNKQVINDAGIPFSGHTEWLAEQTDTAKVVMMLTSGSLRVALATTHLPLRSVADAINKEELAQVIRIIMAELKVKFRINNPRLMVCGLNPHAGEGGHLGREEIEIISPVIEEFRRLDLKIEGPVPADTAFTPGRLANADAVLAMYHDQGLPVLKYQGFGDAINITLGLPIIRTSVDHGTALDLAGTGRANPGSLLAAINCAAELVRPVAA